MNRISARTRIVLGQIALLVSAMMLAIAMGLVPNERTSVVQGRAMLCEAIAVNASILATRDDITGLQAALQGVVNRNRDIISAALRTTDGNLIASVGDHETNWANVKGAQAADSLVDAELNQLLQPRHKIADFLLRVGVIETEHRCKMLHRLKSF